MIRRRRHSPTERPDEFDLNPDSLLADRLVFAGLGRFTGSTLYKDSSLYDKFGTTAKSDQSGKWSRELGRSALFFDGTDDAILLSGTGVITGSSWTVGFFHHTTNTLDGSQGYCFDVSAGRVVIGVGILGYDGLVVNLDGAAEIGNPLSTPAWHHYLVTHTGSAAGGMIGYGDGAAIGSSTSANKSIGGTIRIGSRYSGDSNFVKATLADMMIWSRILSPSEISALADPSNVMLSIGGNPLLRYRRKWWPVSAAAAAGCPWLYGLRSSRVIGGGTL